MPIRRVFFDWKLPALRTAAGFLAEQYTRDGELDLSGVIVAVPGGRAGRHLLTALVDFAEREQLALVPPRIVTAGQLPELLYEVKRPLAGELMQQLAWVEALRAADSRQLTKLVATPPEKHDLAGWMALAQMLALLHRELAADALDFAGVLRRSAELPGFGESERWQALAALQNRYLRTLDRLDVWDKQTARLYAVEHRLCRTGADIVLLATVDMDRTQRAMLDLVADRVTALVFASTDSASRFDEHGCLIASAWRNVPLPIAREQIEIVEGPAEQADAVLRTLASWNGKYAAEEITIGVPDERVAPYLLERLAEAGLPARFGAGVPLARSGPARLLVAVADYLDEGAYRHLAELVRHPDLDAWFRQHQVTGDYCTALDTYYSRHLPASSPNTWPSEQSTTPSADGSPAEPSTAAEATPLASTPNALLLAAAVDQLIRPLAGPARSWADWVEPVRQLLEAVYGDREFDREAETDRAVLAACQAVAECLTECSQLTPQLAPRTPAVAMLRWLLSRIAAERVAPPQAGAIELLGWLELPLDEAPALCATGLNEGIVPSSQNGDLFLPDRLRAALALEDNDRRFARDAYALQVLAASRADLKLIAGRRTRDRDPLSPSRLLFACDDVERAQRARSFFTPGTARPRVVLPHSLRPGRTQTELPVPPPRKLAQPRHSLRVTEFRDYLACPYRYYLQHCLRLTASDDAAEELDAQRFGSLLHEVLERFGRGPLRDASQPAALADHLSDLLDGLAAEEFGTAAAPAVRLQIEQLRLRLRAFASWQADRRRDGWRIQSIEQTFGDEQACLLVDGQKTFLRGRIDRIDVHEADGRLMIFDYKTGDSPKPPDEVHRAAGQWVDLQLPLYRHLVQPLEIAGRQIELGYILLPKDTSRVGAAIAPWTADELAEADQKAADVVRNIRAERFWPPAAATPHSNSDFAAICQDDLFVQQALAEENAETESA